MRGVLNLERGVEGGTVQKACTSTDCITEEERDSLTCCASCPTNPTNNCCNVTATRRGRSSFLGWRWSGFSC